ncbi:putative ABC transporter ATP-binding protein [Paenibacillus konkukensis]|uniref:ABC transporter ATP-binding protein n=1 Tax=Paenibacillus konkukensis TaxID=2020716 RepID=A0ABY4RFD5_9BACL|nr:ABC transporter ATP-binding protein [Paenibacillus konkukensis]UQZ81286.1 putative ABC transporter ATP-binding protein [Paenibacillus konkukensis]
MSQANRTQAAGGRPGMRGPGRGPMGGGFGMPMGMPGQKAKHSKKTFLRLLHYIKPFRVQLTAVLITAVLSTLFNIVSPKLLGNITTHLFEGVMAQWNGGSEASFDFSYILNIVTLLIGLYVCSSLFAFIQQYLMAGVAQKTVYGLRKDVNEKLSRLPLKYYDTQTHGEILSRTVNDMDNISGTLQQSLTQVMTSAITIIGIIVMMLTISPLLTLILLLTLPLSFLVIKAVASRSQAHFAGQQKSLGELNGHVEEMYTGHTIVKAFGHEKKSEQTFAAINERLYEAGWRAQFISGIMMPLMAVVNNIGYVLICVVGGLMVTRSMINIGDIQAFIQYARQFSMPLVQTANIANIIQSTLASAERVFEILDEREEEPDTEAAEACSEHRGHVRFEHVSFGYTEDTPIIQDMNIDVKAGQTVAIVGPTGAGKTTLINLLMRFYEINGGEITIDGLNITQMKREGLRRLFGMVLQDTWLFNGTIRDNIAYGRAGATEAEIVEAAQAAHADHFIRTLPDGYDTVLNEEATNISQGQKQLLTIARAILADPAILILDEATSSVDTRTEAHIQQAMRKLMQGRTNFVIAHRLSTIRDADLILVMNRGSVIEQGRHEELLARGGFYAELYNSQFSGGAAAS